jgi:hypothetical protein
MSEEKTLPSQDDMEKWVLAAASALAPAWRALPTENRPSLGDMVEEALTQQLIEGWREHPFPTTVLALAVIGLRQCVLDVADELANLETSA